MRGHVSKRATWQFVIDRGLHPLQRCPACHKRYWLEGKRLRSCPKCQGPLEDTYARRQEFHTGYKTKREAEEELAKALTALSSGTYVEPRKILLRDYLLGEWLPAIRATVRATTFLSYEQHVTSHVIPLLGSVPLQQLTGGMLNLFYARLLAGEGGGKTRPLSPSTVRRVHATLHRALKDATRWNRLARNPTDAADPPRNAGPPQMQVWNETELKRFLTSEVGSRLYPLWLVLATTGMRRGEVLGLTWEDAALAAGRLWVRKTRVMTGYEVLPSTPKTRRGRRLLYLDPATIAALTSWRLRQKKEHLALGKAWNESVVVFTEEEGEPYHPERVSTLFTQAAKRAHLRPIRLHDLRHSYATLALSAGVHPKVVSERLGHANIGITLDVYSHCVPSLCEEAACRVAALVVPA